MNSRLRICPQKTTLLKPSTLRLGGVWRNGTQTEPDEIRPMSALGQKQTHAVQQRMSALPPIATAKADMPNWSCLLYPQKRTCAAHKLTSALGQKRTWVGSFDQLISTKNKCGRDFNANSFRSAKIDY